MNEKRLIYDLDYTELEEIVKSWGQPAYRARQIWEGLYQQLLSDPMDFSNLPLSLRQKLDKHFSFHSLFEDQILSSKDGETRKTLFRLPDDRAIEAVLMRYSDRRTICISSQAGCAMGCVFCATGQMGFRRNLTSGEIVEQVVYYARLLKVRGEKLTNVVLMGMGEPLHNYSATMSAIDRLNDPNGFNFGARRFTVSTVGLVPAIRRFAAEKRQVNLAISLHSTDDEHRSKMMPVNRKYPISELLDACDEYITQTGRRITFEWALIQGDNDGVEDARKLGGLLQRFVKNGAALCHVNVIPLNPTPGFDGRATPRERAYAFKEELERQGIPCTVRIRRGIDIEAGCGQLAIKAR